jgi:hypothetical protein
MGYLILFWRKFRCLLDKLAELPQHPYSPFYAPWEHMLHQRLDLLRQQAEQDRHIRNLGLQETWLVGLLRRNGPPPPRFLQA